MSDLYVSEESGEGLHRHTFSDSAVANCKGQFTATQSTLYSSSRQLVQSSER